MAKKVVKPRRIVKPRAKSKKMNLKVDPVIVLIAKLVLSVIGVLFLFVSVFTNMGGMIGGFFKQWILTPLFGDGLYYLPFICLYLFYAVIVHIKNKDNLNKIIGAIVLQLFISAGCHLAANLPINRPPYDLGFNNLSRIVSDAQANLNGGVIGTYIADSLRYLAGNIFANIIIVCLNIAAVFMMFNEILTSLIKKVIAFFKGLSREKTTSIFRVPGVKIDKNAERKFPAESIEKLRKEPKGKIEPKVEFPVIGDVIIEKFSDGQVTLEEEKKVPLSKTEVTDVVAEIEKTKDNQPKEYLFPKYDFLNPSGNKSNGVTKEELNNNALKLISTLKDFGVEAEIIAIQEGPAVTRYEVRPQIGVKISKILGLSEDIALRMAAKGIRIAPIPGKTVIGVEIANKKVMPVFVREVIDSKEFKSHKSKVSFALGKDIAGTTIVGDIGKMPHCLIAGSTGSGKSVCINALITSILYKSTPEEVKMIMIDPKVVELSVYNGIPHLLIPVVTDPRKAAGALNWAVQEMLSRYNLFAKSNVRDLESYNDTARQNGEEVLPKILIIVDELADLMVASPKEVEEYICRLAQLARAAGMHLVIATQRPSVDVITGLIKANIPSRIAFAVSSAIDSRTILDMSGAEKLLGKGDMLYAPIGESKPIRVQGALITDKEVERIVNFLKENMDTTYDEDVLEHIEKAGNKDGPRGAVDDPGDKDVMLKDCIEFVVEVGEASVSKLQRRFKLGYSRAARIVDQMEERGIVGPSEGSKARQVLITKEQFIEMCVTHPDYQ